MSARQDFSATRSSFQIIQTRQWLEGTELKAEHAIVKVLQHESAPEQQNLPLSRGGGDKNED